MHLFSTKNQGPLTTMSGAHIIRLLRVPSADKLPFFYAKISASLPDPAVEDDVLVVCEHRAEKLFLYVRLCLAFARSFLGPKRLQKTTY